MESPLDFIPVDMLDLRSNQLEKKKVVAELTLDNRMLKDVVSKKW